MTDALWVRLHQHYAEVADRKIMDLFDQDQSRAEDFSLTLPQGDVGGRPMILDYSKTNLDAVGRGLLLDLAEGAGVRAKAQAMFRGARINDTEGRAVLHVLLRGSGDPELSAQLRAETEACYARCVAFAKDVREGRFVGPEGPFTDVLNIGIGGSDLGPVAANIALSPYRDGPRVHFLSNVDGAQAADILRDLDARKVLVIIASKTFTTLETMQNAATVRDWMAKSVADPGAQMVAVSTAPECAAEWGIPSERVFGFGDYIGGRYSVWGPVGLSLMLAIGPEDFAEFLAGAADMDSHFRHAPFDQNMPVMLALLGIWHNQICGHATRAVLPYDQRLSRLPAYLQQLEMESNGKRVALDGSTLAQHSGPIVWGEPGTNGQHAFYQLLHQGTRVVPCEFLVAARAHEPDLRRHQILLMANCLAQSEALMRGRSLEAARDLMRKAGYEGEELERQARHRVFPGNRPSSTLVYEALTPRTLGRILALYEHRVFVEGVILGINSFDQWGVELGKELAVSLEPLFQEGREITGKDGSTQRLLSYLRAG